MKKNVALLVSLAIILLAGVYSVFYAWGNIPLTYNPDPATDNVVEFYQNPQAAAESVGEADGVADAIVHNNLDKTMAANNVAAVVFDFRGFDTLGESFILLTAIAGSYVILSRHPKAAKSKKEGAK